MAELKSKETIQSPEAFIKAIEDKERQKECLILFELMKKITGEKPKVWSNGVIGFGQYHYKGKSGREGEWYKMGFSSRKQNISINSMLGFEGSKSILEKLGKHKLGVGCLYVNKLADVDMKVLTQLLKEHASKSKEIKSVFH